MTGNKWDFIRWIGHRFLSGIGVALYASKDGGTFKVQPQRVGKDGPLRYIVDHWKDEWRTARTLYLGRDELREWVESFGSEGSQLVSDILAVLAPYPKEGDYE